MAYAGSSLSPKVSQPTESNAGLWLPWSWPGSSLYRHSRGASAPAPSDLVRLSQAASQAPQPSRQQPHKLGRSASSRYAANKMRGGRGICNELNPTQKAPLIIGACRD